MQGIVSTPVIFLAISTVVILALAFFCVFLVVVFNKNIYQKQMEIYRTMLETQEKEQQRIGQDLHDEMGPLLSSASAFIEVLKADEPLTSVTVSHKDLSEVQDLLDEAVIKIRASAHNLMPIYLMNNGLQKTIDLLCGRINNTGKVSAQFTYHNFPPELASLAMINIYRIIQELCTNTLKHADAENLTIEIKTIENNKTVLITTKDDGCGFNLENQYQTGIGMKSIQNRVKLYRGKLVIDSVIGQGTTTNIWFDYNKLT